MSILINLLLGVWGLVALLMMLLILMQRPKSEGLGAAFGGGVTENIFGAQTTNVLVKFTVWLAGIFFFLTFLLSVLYAHKSVAESSLTRELKKTAPATQASPSAAATQSPGQSSPAPVSGAGANPAENATVSPAPGASVVPPTKPAPPAADAQKPKPTPRRR